jgi:hypothetical protein
MLEAYASRLMLPDMPETHEPYRQAANSPTGENKFQIAERFLLEALPIFRVHYKKDNSAILMNECRLAYALAMQEKWSDFDEHYAICKPDEEQLQRDASLSKHLAAEVELVEKTLIEKKRRVIK